MNSLLESDEYIKHHHIRPLRAQPRQGTAARDLEVHILVTLRLEWRNRPHEKRKKSTGKSLMEVYGVFIAGKITEL